MTASTRYERNLPGILDDLSAGPAPEYLDDVFARTGRMRQRPGWTFPERWLPVADIARTRAFAPAPPWRLIAVALVLIALVLAALVVVGSQRKVAPPFGPARNGEIVYDSAGDLYVGNPDHRYQPVAGRRSRSGQRARLLAGRHPGRVPPGRRLLSADRRHLRGARRMDRDCARSRPDRSFRRCAWANWTPDSRHLAIIERRRGRSGGHRAPRRGWPRGAAPAGARTWTSDRRRLPPARWRRRSLFRAIVDEKFGVYVMNADGTDIRPLLEPVSDSTMDLPRCNYGLLGRRGTALLPELRPGRGRQYRRVLPALGHERGRHGRARLRERNRTAWTGVPTVSPDGRWVSYWSVLGDSANQQIGSPRPTELGRSIGTGPAMQATSSRGLGTRFVEDPDDAGGRLNHLGVPDRSRGWALEHRPVGIRLGPRLAAPGALTSFAPRVSADCSPSERSVGRCHGPVTGRE